MPGSDLGAMKKQWVFRWILGVLGGTKHHWHATEAERLKESLKTREI
jgi:hypothetical protein